MEYVGIYECIYDGWTVDQASITNDYQEILKWKQDKINSNNYLGVIVVPISDVLFTEDDIRDAYDGGFENCDETTLDKFSLEDFIISKKVIQEVEEETVPITLGQIKASCGWSRYADVTGANPYMINEWNPSDREIFDVKKSDAKKLNLI